MEGRETDSLTEKRESGRAGRQGSWVVAGKGEESSLVEGEGGGGRLH